MKIEQEALNEWLEVNKRLMDEASQRFDKVKDKDIFFTDARMKGVEFVVAKTFPDLGERERILMESLVIQYVMACIRRIHVEHGSANV